MKEGILFHNSRQETHQGISDISVTETQTDTEMIDISKTHTETNTEKVKRFSILLLYTHRNDRVKKLTETVIEMTLKTDTEIICLPCLNFFELSNHVSECTQNAPFRGKKIKQISDSPSPYPFPWEGDTPPKPQPLCSNIVVDKTVTEMM